MRMKPSHATRLLLVLAGLLLIAILGMSVAVHWSQWRENAICGALAKSEEPGFWWPPSWRQELQTSTLLEGDLLKAQSGTIEFMSVGAGEVFTTPVVRGKYSFNRRRLPAGAFMLRYIAPDGSAAKWGGPLELDGGGRHRLNLDF
jgi:hypothetical protein